MRHLTLSALLLACAAVAMTIAGAAAAPAGNSAKVSVTVTNPPPATFFSLGRYWPTPFTIPPAVSTCEVIPRAWHWDFGDGARSDEQNPAYTYTINGDYSISLTVTDRYGRSTKTT